LINVIDRLNPLDVADADGVVRPHYIAEDIAVVRSACDNRRLELIFRAASFALGFAVAATAQMYAGSQADHRRARGAISEPVRELRRVSGTDEIMKQSREACSESVVGKSRVSQHAASRSQDAMSADEEPSITDKSHSV